MVVSVVTVRWACLYICVGMPQCDVYKCMRCVQTVEPQVLYQLSFYSVHMYITLFMGFCSFYNVMKTVAVKECVDNSEQV